MAGYWKEGFWRTSCLGNEHWVRGHWVGRDDWDHSSVNNGEGNYFSSSSTTNFDGKAQFFGEVQSQKTYLTTCWWCGETVFYHTNGYGDCVLFDPPLGWPWYIHSCWREYSEGQKTASDISHMPEDNPYPPPSSPYFDQDSKSLIQDLFDSPDENLIDHIIENTFPEINQDYIIENNHSVLLELVKAMIDRQKLSHLVSIGKCSIIVFSELKLSRFVGISVDEFRQCFEQFYVRYHGAISIKTIPFTKIYHQIDSKKNHEKHQLIIWATKGMKDLKKWKFGIYLTEIFLASRMGLSLQDLRLHFGKIYTAYTSGKIYVPFELPKDMQDKPRKQIQKPIKKRNQNQNERPFKRNNKDKIVRPKTNNTRIKNNSSTGLFTCPYCNEYLSSDKSKIRQHIKKKHPDIKLP